uniref:Succinate-semialdehyde dehydrogenase n=1 Tax=Clastoptera arizonana TaxID=38151 RepID=A0A1B6CLL5_9HEMI
MNMKTARFGILYSKLLGNKTRDIYYKNEIYNNRFLSLLHNKSFVDGEWVEAKSKKSFTVYNPANNKAICDVPDMDVVDVEIAIEAANKAFNSWSNTTAKERGILLRRWYDLMQSNSKELSKIITIESGKPIGEANVEVNYGNSFVDWFAEESRRIYGEIIPSPNKSKQILLVKQPIGAVALITPWNFPHAMITRKAAAALAAGCTCVIKPAEDTPLTALALADLAQKAGIPKGVINVVSSGRPNAANVGKLLCTSPKIAGLSFTGSTAVGKLLYKQCASGVKRIGLELGGNAPFIVFNSADLDKAVEGALAAKFRNCGQTCVSANRFLIQAEIFDEFVNKFEEKIKTLNIGDGMDSKVTQGPLINAAQVSKVERIVDDAVKKGANVVCGGKKASDIGELFFQPTILTNINKDMDCYTEEIFGPIAVCIKFQTEEEAVAIGNSTSQGLAGYFYSNDVVQVWRVAMKIQTAMVGVNEGIISTAEAPFGGIKESGIGREGSRYGIDEYVFIKYICLGNLKM